MRDKKTLVVLILLLCGLRSAAAWPADLSQIQALADRGRTQEALRRLEDFLVADPYQLEGQFLRGVLLAELGRNGDAERTFRALNNDYPDRPEPIHNLAVLQALAGRPATAVIALEELVDRYPGYMTAARNLDRIRRGAAGGDFDPLSSNGARVALELTPRLGSFPLSRPTAETAPTPVAAAVAPSPPVAEIDVEPDAVGEVAEPEPVAAAVRAAVPASEPDGQPASPPPATAAGMVAAETEPSPEAAPAPGVAAADLRAELTQVVTAWAAAWSQQRLREYLEVYAADFQPAGFPSRQAWETARRQRVAAPSFIEVEIDLDSMTVSRGGPDEASVKFIQSYRSDRYSDTVQKTLVLVRRDGAWQIRNETSQ